jgi:hypothetical protein
MMAWVVGAVWVVVAWLVLGCLVTPWAVYLLTDDDDGAEGEDR